VFVDRGYSGDRKWRTIEDDASDVRLTLDTDDVNPADVSEWRVARIVRALNREFYPRAGRSQSDAVAMSGEVNPDTSAWAR
jgi:hypothetical protein